MVILRLSTENRMVTKGYPRGVYEWVEGEFGNWEGAIESLSHRIIESFKTASATVGFPVIQSLNVSMIQLLGSCRRDQNEDHEDENQGPRQLAQNFPGYVTHL
jgi:hypothetical protein